MFRSQTAPMTHAQSYPIRSSHSTKSVNEWRLFLPVRRPVRQAMPRTLVMDSGASSGVGGAAVGAAAGAIVGAGGNSGGKWGFSSAHQGALVGTGLGGRWSSDGCRKSKADLQANQQMRTRPTRRNHPVSRSDGGETADEPFEADRGRTRRLAPRPAPL
jgi:hypothetical protein